MLLLPAPLSFRLRRRTRTPPASMNRAARHEFAGRAHAASPLGVTTSPMPVAPAGSRVAPSMLTGTLTLIGKLSPLLLSLLPSVASISIDTPVSAGRTGHGGSADTAGAMACAAASARGGSTIYAGVNASIMPRPINFPAPPHPVLPVPAAAFKGG